MRTYPQDLKSKTDLGGIVYENFLEEELVKPIYEFAKSVTETSSKKQEPKTYDQTINGPIYSNI